MQHLQIKVYRTVYHLRNPRGLGDFHRIEPDVTGRPGDIVLHTLSYTKCDSHSNQSYYSQSLDNQFHLP